MKATPFAPVAPHRPSQQSVPHSPTGEHSAPLISDARRSFLPSVNFSESAIRGNFHGRLLLGEPPTLSHEPLVQKSPVQLIRITDVNKTLSTFSQRHRCEASGASYVSSGDFALASSACLVYLIPLFYSYFSPSPFCRCNIWFVYFLSHLYSNFSPSPFCRCNIYFAYFVLAFIPFSLSPSPLCRCDIYLILFPLHDAIPRRWRRMNTYATSSISCCESVMGNIPPV